MVDTFRAKYNWASYRHVFLKLWIQVTQIFCLYSNETIVLVLTLFRYFSTVFWIIVCLSVQFLSRIISRTSCPVEHKFNVQ